MPTSTTMLGAENFLTEHKTCAFMLALIGSRPIKYSEFSVGSIDFSRLLPSSADYMSRPHAPCEDVPSIISGNLYSLLWH